MCARYIIKGNTRKFAKGFGAKIVDEGEGFSETRIVPRKFGPVIYQKDGEILMTPMMFSLTPKWSKDGKVKFATFNTRLDSVDKPTWKRPFETQRCLIPISAFFEPIYTGKFAGHWVSFSQEDEPLIAAGIWDSWVNKETGEELNSFSMITHDPLPQVKKAGHPRSPLFLEKNAWKHWIEEGKRELKVLQIFAAAHRLLPDLKVEQDDAMRPGWEKRIPKE